MSDRIPNSDMNSLVDALKEADKKAGDETQTTQTVSKNKASQASNAALDFIGLGSPSTPSQFDDSTFG